MIQLALWSALPTSSPGVAWRYPGSSSMSYVVTFKDGNFVEHRTMPRKTLERAEALADNLRRNPEVSNVEIKEVSSAQAL